MSDILRLGHESEDVKTLQAALDALGVPLPRSMIMGGFDGVLGAETWAAVDHWRTHVAPPEAPEWNAQSGSMPSSIVEAVIAAAPKPKKSAPPKEG